MLRAGEAGLGAPIPTSRERPSVYFNESEHPFVIDCFLRQE